MALRWAFPDASEDVARAAVDARIDAWWASLALRREALLAHLDGRGGSELGAYLDAGLATIDPGLRWELGRGLRHPCRLLLSVEAERHLTPLLERVLARAPGDLGLELVDHRPPEPVEVSRRRALAAAGVDPLGWPVEVQPGPHGLVDLCFRAPRSDERVHRAALTFAQGVLGERTLLDWGGAITVEPPRSLVSKLLGGTRGHDATTLGARVARASADWLSRQADQRLLVSSRRGRDANWSLVRLEPPRGHDFGAQRDLVSARTADVELFQAARSGAPFSSCRFSRFGETFLYLKTDGFSDDGFATTLAVEEALDRALAEGGLGRAIGAGSGTRYSYVDLVVSDARLAIERALPVLRAGKLPARAWLLFFDDTLAAEWVGVWPHTPAPPPFPASQ